MKAKLLLLCTALCFSGIFYLGFTPNDDSPKWNQDPRTRINLGPVGDYKGLPVAEYDEPVYTGPTQVITPQGIFSVGAPFRVHPRNSPATQSETPITRHPLNPLIMYGSANTFQSSAGGNFCTGWYVTTDGGITWNGNDTMFTTGGASQFNFGDPAPMIDNTGRFLISYITLTGSMGASFSTNNGANWATTVTFPGASTSADKNLSTTDDDPTSAFYGRDYTVYTDFAGSFVNRICLSYTTNQGVSWSTIAPVSPVPSTGHHHQGCDVRVGPGGVVYVCWANCTTNGQNSTEDSLGFARSTDGGVSWALTTNHAANMNGIRAASLFNSIRANGFPRIDVDRTCGAFAGNIYVVAAEKTPLSPAHGVADVVLYKSTNQGTSWSLVKVNQNTDSTKYDYCPAVRVDESGAVNVCYYSTRNSAGNTQAQIFLSRSTDGGSTFADVQISSLFTPTPITNTATGYQGDYIGITSGGAGKILPYWCEGGATSYNAWTSLVDVTVNSVCEDFSCSSLTIPTSSLYEEYSGVNYWSRQVQSAYAIGAGSARFDAFDAASGTNQSLISYNLASGVPASTYLTFDEAYAPYGASFPGPDSLVVQTSANGGTSYSTLKILVGRVDGTGELNSAPATTSNFVPTGGQWRPKIYLLPVGTNKIKLSGRSGFGNSMWVDNVCVQTLPAAVGSTVGLACEGMFIPTDPYWRLEDTIKVYLCRTDFPNVRFDSATAVMSSNAVSTGLFFNNALSGTYYRVVRQRNTIETWSNVGVAYTRGATSHHNFIQPDGQAFGNNQAIVSTSPFYRGMYSGDIDQNYFIDLVDIDSVYNDASVFTTGYKTTDVTGDNFTNLSDLIIVYNNSTLFVQRVAPPGAEPAPAPMIELDASKLTFESDAARQKYEMSKMKTNESESKNNAERIKLEEKMKLYQQKHDHIMKLMENKNINNGIEEQDSNHRAGER